MKKLLFIFSFALILDFTNLAFGQNASLPTGVQNILNQNYPKWKVVKNVCQTAASGDFNGDKKTDYIVVITYQNGGSVVGFVSQGNDFRPIVVDSLSKKDAETSAVNPARKGSEVLVGGTIGDTDAKFAKLKSDGFYYGSCESDDGTAYIFKNNGFVSAYGSQGGNNNNNPNSNNGGCSGKTYPITKAAGEICFPQGDISFADELVSFQIGAPYSNDNQYGNDMTNPQEAIGIPNSRQKENKWNAVALGSGGVLTVKFTNNALIDVDGIDLYAFEVGSNVEPTKVEISKNGRNWIYVGELRGDVSGLDIGGKARPGEEFYFVRLTDLRANNTRPIGADIDAIGAIGSVRKNSSQVPGAPDGSSSGNNSVNNNPPPTSPGSRTVKLFFYKPKKGDTRCATNLVPVNRQISGSQSVLRESLNALFGDDDSGLDDYTTGLSLVNVSITNGVANIVVTGAQNSACASLFEEQVRKTAMQFPTVKQVNIKSQD